MGIKMPKSNNIKVGISTLLLGILGMGMKMPELPNNIGDREYQKFVVDAEGNPSVRIAPGAVTDTDGNELDIDDVGRAQMYDRNTHNELKNINENLKDILFQLKLITGA
jgi:hypothetical protein